MEELEQAAADEDIEDALLEQARDIVTATDRASTSLLQRKPRPATTGPLRLIDLLEDEDVVGPPEGNSRTREVLMRLSLIHI